MSRSFQITLAALAFLAAGGGLGLLHLKNEQLRRKLDRAQSAQLEAARLRNENSRLETLLAAHAHDAQSATRAVRDQLAHVRREIDTLEKRAAEHRAELDAKLALEAATLASNRNPQSGLTRLEHFRDVGQATPSAAFQTMVHAAMKGDEATLLRLFSVPPATRARAAELISRLPEDARAKWTAEKLAMLWVTGAFTELPALQITGEHLENTHAATVTFSAPQFRQGEKVNLKHTPEGWKITVGTGMISNLEKKLLNRTPTEPR